MPLSPPIQRERLHTRSIQIDGYRRDDGNYDIEAHLTDVKAHGQANHDRGYIEAGDPIHDMWLRLTLDDEYHVLAVEACSDKTPYATCPQAAGVFSGLAGLRIKAGFMREVTHRVGGVIGCTHLRELLQQMATAAFQTINAERTRREMMAEGTHSLEPGSDSYDRRISEKWDGGKRMLNTCLAYDEKGPVVQRRWPQLFKAAAE